MVLCREQLHAYFHYGKGGKKNPNKRPASLADERVQPKFPMGICLSPRVCRLISDAKIVKKGKKAKKKKNDSLKIARGLDCNEGIARSSAAGQAGQVQVILAVVSHDRGTFIDTTAGAAHSVARPKAGAMSRTCT